jgi:hypothetical protein
MRGDAMTVLHEALGVGFVIPGNLLVLCSGYIATLATLVIFGVWGFRLGAKGPGGNGGGGPRRPGPISPPSGGRELDNELPPSDLDARDVFERSGLAEDAGEPDRELVGPRSGG